MALPLPRIVSDVGPGGGLVTAMGGINALNNDMLLRKINAIKAQYAPLTAQADAASKLAYANLMGPQFLAKIMGNDSALANMSEDQKKAALNKIYQAGSGQGGVNAFNQLPQAGNGGGMFSGVGQPSTNSASGWVLNKLKEALGQTPQGVGNRNAINAPPGANSGYDRDPGVINSGSPFVGRSGYKAPEPEMILGNNPAIVEAFRQSPEGQGKIAQEGENYIPDEEELRNWYRSQKGNQNPMELTVTKGQRPNTYAENTGAYKGIVQEGTETGKIRAKDIDHLNTTVFNAETHQATLDDISSILSSPEFEQIRQVPLLGHHELAYYSKEGTPEQQQMVGRYFTDTGNVIKDSARDFAGQFRKGEQQLLNGMKPNASDTVDTARGKVESLSYFNKMLAERSRLTSKIMSEFHVNKLAAQEIADSQINGQKIRQDIHAKLNPMVTIKNNKTGETRTISIAEARKLGVPNV